MEFIIERILDYEMIHFASDDTFIASKGNKIFYNEKVIEIPENPVSYTHLDVYKRQC